MSNERGEFITAMRAMADWLEANPDVPLDTATCFTQLSLINGDESERMLQAEAVAVAMGVDFDRRDRRAVAATRVFGPHVEFTVHASTDYGRTACEAENTYTGAVTP